MKITIPTAINLRNGVKILTGKDSNYAFKVEFGDKTVDYYIMPMRV